MSNHIAIIGAGPAGLMAAETLSGLGYTVNLYDAMPSVARKFLMAGKSGLNITHAENYTLFQERFGAASRMLAPIIDAFKPEDVVEWANSLGIETFVGSSGKVFPVHMKASPLLRAWLHRLETRGVRLKTRHRFTGFSGNDLCFETPEGSITSSPDACLFAMGGASWPRLGSDGTWAKSFEQIGARIAPFSPANCGFDVSWSEHFRQRFPGEPVKNVVATSEAGSLRGEFVITQNGVEGSLIYHHAAALREQHRLNGNATLYIDLVPDRERQRLERDLERQPAKASFSNRLRKGAGLSGVKAALLKETDDDRSIPDRIKSFALPIRAPRPIAEAISTAGGITWDSLDDNLMIRTQPGTFVAGEMIDWEAPTGGYLITACLATGRHAALGLHRYLTQ